MLAGRPARFSNALTSARHCAGTWVCQRCWGIPAHELPRARPFASAPLAGACGGQRTVYRNVPASRSISHIESETPDTSSRPTSEGAGDVPLTVPERPLAEDHPAREATSTIPPVRSSASNDNEGDSIAPDRLFGASESPRSNPPKAPDLSSSASTRSKLSPLFLRVPPSRG